MSMSRDVRFWEIRPNKSSKRKKTYEVRWKVGGRERSRTFETKALAKNFLLDLQMAAKRGEEFEIKSGLPESMIQAKEAVSWLGFVQACIASRWPHAAAKTRDSMTDALATVTPVLVTDAAGMPEAETVRTALRQYALLPADRRPADPSPEIVEAVRWLEKVSLPLAALAQTATVHAALDALALKMDGNPAAAETYRRKRAVFYNVLQYAAELEELPANPLDRIKSQWRRPKVVETVDRRGVVNPRQAKELLTAVSYVGRRRGRPMVALFACMYYAGLRPGEAVALRKQDCHLPATGWGTLTLETSRPQTGKRWTDSGEAHDKRGLKQRADKETREVPIPPELVRILLDHIAEFGVAEDGRLFRSQRGNVVSSSSYYRVWREARLLALTPEQVASPLAGKPYDLRHAALSLWLNAGVHAPEVAQRAGHTVDVLLQRYAKCLDGDREIANGRISRALGS